MSIIINYYEGIRWFVRNVVKCFPVTSTAREGDQGPMLFQGFLSRFWARETVWLIGFSQSTWRVEAAEKRMEGEIAGQSHRISRDLAKQHAKPKWSKGQGKSEVSVFTWKKRSARCTKKRRGGKWRRPTVGNAERKGNQRKSRRKSIEECLCLVEQLSKIILGSLLASLSACANPLWPNRF